MNLYILRTKKNTLAVDFLLIMLDILCSPEEDDEDENAMDPNQAETDEA